MSSYEFIKTERQESTLIARLSNPPRHLLNAKMVLELGALAREVEEDASVRSLILTGDAEGTFITHYDVGELSAASDTTREQEPPAGDAQQPPAEGATETAPAPPPAPAPAPVTIPPSQVPSPPPAAQRL